MKKIYLALFAFCSMPAMADEQSLTDTMTSLDTELFQSFNNCKIQKELEKHANFFSPDTEFYHDNGGVTWDRETMISNTRKYACGNYTRELVSGTLKVYPIKDFGAITEGVHIFCNSETKKCDGKANFVMVWRKTDNKWEITRSLSYGHRDNN